jgi:Ca2+-binding RTX toxin-like protein
MRRVVSVAFVVLVAAFPGQAAAAPPKCFGQIATITDAGTINGTPGDDVIVGSNGDDTIEGAGGNDVICGRGGNDVISSLSMTDDLTLPARASIKFNGGKGRDQLFAPNNTADITLIGGDDTDYLEGRRHSDLVTSGTSYLSGGDGGDLIDGTSVVSGINAFQTNVIEGGAGDDLIATGIPSHATLSATVNGGSGDDGIAPNTFPVDYSYYSEITLELNGGSGDDTIYGFTTDDLGLVVARNTLNGDQGNDELRGGNGIETTNAIDGGSNGKPGDTCHRGVGSSDKIRRCEQIV